MLRFWTLTPTRREGGRDTKLVTMDESEEDRFGTTSIVQKQLQLVQGVDEPKKIEKTQAKARTVSSARCVHSLTSIRRYCAAIIFSGSKWHGLIFVSRFVSDPDRRSDGLVLILKLVDPKSSRNSRRLLSSCGVASTCQHHSQRSSTCHNVNNKLQHPFHLRLSQTKEIIVCKYTVALTQYLSLIGTLSKDDNGYRQTLRKKVCSRFGIFYFSCIVR